MILKQLKHEHKTIAIASRTTAPLIALEFLERFHIKQYFDIMEIYPSGKTAHLWKILKATKSNGNDIVFFDDEMRNIEDISRLNIDCVHIKSGISLQDVRVWL